MGRRFTRAQEQAIIGAYEDWDSETQSVTQLCAQLEISRQGLYQVLARNHIPLKGAAPDVLGSSDNIAREMANQALRVLMDELVKARCKVVELEKVITDLRKS